jgi:Zn-dependent peptidase ImmA (M78 family)
MSRLSDSLTKLVTDYDHLARRSKITRNRLIALAEGAEPLTAEVRAISTALKLSIPSLLQASKRSGSADLRFRGARQRSLAASEARIFSVVDALRGRLKVVSKKKFPRLSASLDDAATIEKAALEVRSLLVPKDLVLDPLPNLAPLLDTAGLARVIRLKNLSVHGAATQIEGQSVIFVASQFFPRSLFSIAHELGHLVFGHLEGKEMIIDADNFGSTGNSNSEERLCDSFASTLLIPAESLGPFLKMIRSQLGIAGNTISSTEILYVSHYFATSFLVAAFRFEQLGLLGRGEAVALDREIAKEYGNAEKLAALGGVPERLDIDIPVLPKSLRMSMREEIFQGNMSLGYLSDAFGLSVGEMQNALT